MCTKMPLRRTKMGEIKVARGEELILKRMEFQLGENKIIFNGAIIERRDKQSDQFKLTIIDTAIPADNKFPIFLPQSFHNCGEDEFEYSIRDGNDEVLIEIKLIKTAVSLVRLDAVKLIKALYGSKHEPKIVIEIKSQSLSIDGYCSSISSMTAVLSESFSTIPSATGKIETLQIETSGEDFQLSMKSSDKPELGALVVQEMYLLSLKRSICTLDVDGYVANHLQIGEPSRIFKRVQIKKVTNKCNGLKIFCQRFNCTFTRYNKMPFSSLWDADKALENGLVILCPASSLEIEATRFLRFLGAYVESDCVSLKSPFRMVSESIIKIHKDFYRAGFVSAEFMSIILEPLTGCSKDDTAIQIPFFSIELPWLFRSGSRSDNEKVSTSKMDWIKFCIGLLVQLALVLAPRLARWLTRSYAITSKVSKGLLWSIVHSNKILSCTSIISALFEILWHGNATRCINLVEHIVDTFWESISGGSSNRAALPAPTTPLAITFPKSRESMENLAQSWLKIIKNPTTWAESIGPFLLDVSMGYKRKFSILKLGLPLPAVAFRKDEVQVWDFQPKLRRLLGFSYNCTALSVEQIFGKPYGSGVATNRGIYTFSDQNYICRKFINKNDDRKHSLWGMINCCASEQFKFERCHENVVFAEAPIISFEGSDIQYANFKGETIQIPKDAFVRVLSATTSSQLSQEEFDKWLNLLLNRKTEHLHLEALNSRNHLLPRTVYPNVLQLNVGGVSLAPPSRNFQKDSFGAEGGLMINSADQPFNAHSARAVGDTVDIRAQGMNFYDLDASVNNLKLVGKGDMSFLDCNLEAKDTLHREAETGSMSDHRTKTNAGKINSMRTGQDHMVVDSEHTSSGELDRTVGKDSIMVGASKLHSAGNLVNDVHGQNVTISLKGPGPTTTKKSGGRSIEKTVKKTKEITYSPSIISDHGTVQSKFGKSIDQSATVSAGRGFDLYSPVSMQYLPTKIKKTKIKTKKFLKFIPIYHRKKVTKTCVPCTLITGPGGHSRIESPFIHFKGTNIHGPEGRLDVIAKWLVLERTVDKRKIKKWKLLASIKFPLVERLVGMFHGKYSQLTGSIGGLIRQWRKTDHVLEKAINAICQYPDLARDVNTLVKVGRDIQNNQMTNAAAGEAAFNAIADIPIIDIGVNQSSKETQKRPAKNGMIDTDVLNIHADEMELLGGPQITANSGSLDVKHMVLKPGIDKRERSTHTNRISLSFNSISAGSDMSSSSSKTHVPASIRFRDHLQANIDRLELHNSQLSAGSVGGQIRNVVNTNHKDMQKHRTTSVGVRYNFLTGQFQGYVNTSSSKCTTKDKSIKTRQSGFSVSTGFASNASTSIGYDKVKTHKYCDSTGRQKSKTNRHSLNVILPNKAFTPQRTPALNSKNIDEKLKQNLEEAAWINELAYGKGKSPDFDTRLNNLIDSCPNPVMKTRLEKFRDTQELFYQDGNTLGLWRVDDRNHPQSITIAMAGTQSIGDVLKDTLIAGKAYNTTEFDKVLRIYDDLRKDHPHVPITIIGHSKAASEAEAIAAARNHDGNLRVISFNPGCGVPVGRALERDDFGSVPVTRAICNGDLTGPAISGGRFTRKVALPTGPNLVEVTFDRTQGCAHRLANFQ